MKKKDENVMGTLFSPHVKFAFGPFRVEGNFSEIKYIREGTKLHDLGFQKMQTIQDLASGNAKAVLLYGVGDGNDTVICIPNKFQSWEDYTSEEYMVVIIHQLTLTGIGTGIITQKTSGSKPSFHLVSGYHLKNTPSGNNEFRPGSVEFLIMTFLAMSTLENNDTVIRNKMAQSGIFGKYISGNIVRVVETSLYVKFPPEVASSSEYVKFCELNESSVFSKSIYKIRSTENADYECEFQESGEFYPRPMSSGILLSDAFRMMRSSEIAEKWFPNQDLLDIFEFSDAFDKIYVHRQKLTLSLMKLIEPDFTKHFNAYGIRLDPQVTSKEDISTTDDESDKFKDPIVNLENRSVLISESLEAENEALFCFVKSYTTNSIGKNKSWSRTSCKLIWTAKRVIYEGGVKDIIIRGFLIRDWKNRILASTHWELSRANGEIDWTFNTGLLYHESHEKTDPDEYIRNFKCMAEAIGVNTASFDTQLGQYKTMSIIAGFHNWDDTK